MKSIVVDDGDVEAFARVKRESAFAVAELYAFKYLRKKFKESTILGGGLYDFIVQGKDVNLLVEVKLNHVSPTYDQISQYYQEYSVKYRLWLISNKKPKTRDYIIVSASGAWLIQVPRFKVYLKLRDRFGTSIGDFYVFELYVEKEDKGR